MTFLPKKQSSLSLDVKTLFVKENPGNFRKSGSEKTLKILTHKIFHHKIQDQTRKN